MFVTFVDAIWKKIIIFIYRVFNGFMEKVFSFFVEGFQDVPVDDMKGIFSC